MTEFQAVGAYVGIGFAIGWLAQWLRGGGYMGRSSEEMVRSTTHRPPPPPMPKCKPSRHEIQVLPGNADRIVLSYPDFMNIDQRWQAREMFNACMQRGDKVLLLEGGITLVAVFAAQGEEVVSDRE